MRPINIRNPRVGSAFTPLEPRQLLAATFTGTDADNDQYTIKLTGPGDLAVTTSLGGTSGFIQNLVYSNTITSSKISISVKKAGGGNGIVNIFQGGGTSPLGSFSAPSSDLLESVGLSFGVLGKLVLRDTIDDANIAIGGTSTDKVEITVRDMGVGSGDSGIQCTSRVKSFKGRAIDSGFLLAAGIDSFKATSAEQISLGVDPGVLPANGLSVGSLTVTGAAAIFAEITGDVGSIKAASFDGTSEVLVSGRLGSVTSTSGAIGGEWNSATYGAITAKTLLQGVWIAHGITPTGSAFDKVKAATVTVDYLGIGKGAPLGRIEQIDVGIWTAGQVIAGAFGTIKTKTDFRAELSALDAGSTVSVKSAKVGGTLDNTWSVASDIGDVTAATNDPGNQWVIQPIVPLSESATDIGKLTFTKSTGDAHISLHARTIKSLVAKGTTELSFTLDAQGLDGLAFGSLDCSGQAFLNGQFPGSAGFGKLTAGAVQGTMTGGWVGPIKMTSKNGTNGSFTMNLTLASTDPQGFAIKSITAGQLFNTQLRVAAGRIGPIDASALRLTTIRVGDTSPLSALPSSLPGGFAPVSRIDSITIRRPFNLAPALEAVSDSLVVAREIGAITINGRTITNNNGSTFGFAAQSFGKVTLRDANNVKVTPAIGPAAGDFAPFAGSGDFLFRVLPA